MKPLTEEQIIQRHYEIAEQMSDQELARHALVSTRNHCRCGTCFCCVAVKVLRKRHEVKS